MSVEKGNEVRSIVKIRMSLNDNDNAGDADHLAGDAAEGVQRDLVKQR